MNHGVGIGIHHAFLADQYINGITQGSTVIGSCTPPLWTLAKITIFQLFENFPVKWSTKTGHR
ncbi:hypothetical protein, partial [Escherichia coli]|uniref:hypothetical protein n=1 Tax=Escherichia coli TaxID=562 RepID=UPI00207BF827